MPGTILLATTMGWPFPAQLAGAFAGAGAQVQALAPATAILARSRHPSRLHLYSSLAPMDCLNQAIAAAKPDLIVPCDDLAARLVAQAKGEPLLGRLEFLSRAAEAGVAIAPTQQINRPEYLESAIEKLGLPLVLKLDHSWGGEGVLIAASRQEAMAGFRRFSRQSRLRDLLRVLRGRGMHFLTQALYPVFSPISGQAFVTGAAATSSLACWRGKVVASHHFDVRVSTTSTSPASVIAISDCRQMTATAETVARTFNLSGLFGLDYIRDGRGQVHLLEMNWRATPTMHLALEQDLAASLLRAAGLPASFRPAVTDKKQIALFPREWLRDPASPWLTRAYHDVPWDDPEVMRACIQEGSGEAHARLKASGQESLTTEKPIFGG